MMGKLQRVLCTVVSKVGKVYVCTVQYLGRYSTR
jgi:hypothetical protein